MSGHYPTHGDQNMDTIQRLSLHSLKKNKNKNKPYTFWPKKMKSFYAGSSSTNNKMRTALLVGRQTRGRVPGWASCPGQDTDMPDATALLWLQ